jgi:zinc protease
MKVGFVILLALCILAPTMADDQGAALALSSYRLDNGLEVAMVEDHSSPFARVDLVFRAGAIAQGSESAGYFHLLEHLLLGGGPGPESIAKEIEALAPLDWNGETAAESFTFKMKPPSASVEAALGIWGSMVQVEGFGAELFDAAKAEIAREASTRLVNSDEVYEAAMTKRLFPKYPWRRDPLGNPATIAKATPDALAKLKAAWIVPGNALLVIVGDIDPAALRDAVAKSFGAWKAAPSPWKTPLPPQPKLGVARPTWFFLADPKVPEGLALAEIRYRGPDIATDLGGSIAGDLWTSLVEPPEGRLATALAKALPSLHGAPVVRYLSQKDGGTISVSASLDLGKPGSLLDRVRAFKETFRGNEVTDMRNDPSYFSSADFEAARARLVDDRARSMDDVDARAAEIEFSWTSASLDYFRGYEDKVKAAGAKDVGAFLDTYILHNLEVVAVRLNPADAERESASLLAGGFEVQKPASSFWWQGR